MAVLISERAMAILALEDERRELWRQAQEVSARQMHATATFAGNMLRMSGEHAAILAKMAAIDETEGKL